MVPVKKFLNALGRIQMSILIGILIILATIFGWRFGKAYTFKLTEEEKNLSEQLKKTVFYLASELGNRNYQDMDKLNAAADYIVTEFKAYGYAVKEQTYTIGDQEFRNIIAEKEAVPEGGPTPATIIVGAHYDSCYNPGADDNASGVAALLALARLLKDESIKTAIKFIAFTNEEPPFFKSEMMGSQKYAKEAKDNNESIKLVVIFEMLAFFKDKPFSQRYPLLVGPFFPNRGHFIAMVSNLHSRKPARQFYRAFRQSSDFPGAFAILPSFIPGIDWSDHASFWKMGYPAIMLTDTAFYRNPHYHQSSDLPDTLDYPRLTKLVLGLKQALVRFANE